MELNTFGNIVAAEWLRSNELRPELNFADFVVMPNHFHGLVVRETDAKPRAGSQRAHSGAPLHRESHSLGAIVAGFKAATTKRINTARNAPGMPVWQRNYYEHIVRNEEDLARIRDYIATNPARWAQDRFHLAH